MRKVNRLFLLICALCLCLAAAFCVTACGGDDTEKTVPVVSVTLNVDTAELDVGEELTLTVTVLPSNATDKATVWTSSDEAVATVSDGIVTALKAGTAAITVTAGGKSATCQVTVKEQSGENIPVNNVTLSKDQLELTVGESFKLTPTVLPANATDRTVVWKSSSACVTVSDKGEVSAVSAGKATVTATAGGKSATCAVTVTQKTEVGEVTLDRQTLQLTVGESATLAVTVEPDVAKDVEVVWTTSSAAIATVSDGVVTAKAAGSATVTATAGGKSAACEVTVSPKTVAVTDITLSKTALIIEAGSTEVLTASVLPADATDRAVEWSSSNENVATVTNGAVLAKAEGTATVTATAGGKSATCAVTVTKKDARPVSGAVTYAYAGQECAAFEWEENNAAGAKVEYKLSSAESYTQIDRQLIRQQSPSLARADVLGLKGGEKYDFKITSSGGKVTYAKNVSIAAYDRTGYAHFGYGNGVGAYNDDGTLKAGAKIIYVTEENKNDVDGKGNSIAEYLAAQRNNKTPIVVRIIGTVGSATWNEIEYNEKGKEGDDITVDKVVGVNNKPLPTDKNKLTQAELIKDGYNTLNEYPAKLGGAKCVAIDGLVSKANYTAAKDGKPAEYDSVWNDCQVQNVSNITVEGVGEGAEIFQWGFTFKSCNSVEVRNLRFFDYTEDACSFEGSEDSETLSGFKHKNFWLHHNTFDIGVNYWDVCPEQDKHDGDGSTDFKYLAYVTVAYNRYNGTHKTGLVGGSDTAHQACFTFHHNYYNGCDQRMPLGRQANMHMYNNYYCSSGLYSISLRAGAYAFIENCVFTSAKNSTTPIELRTGDSMPSAKVMGCEITGKINNAYSGENNLYVGNDRTATVAGGNLYGLNFELDPDFYTVKGMLSASEVKTVIPNVAGVMQRNPNVETESGGDEPPVVNPDPPVTPTDGQSLSYTTAGAAVAVDETVSDGEFFTAVWNTKNASVLQGKSAAVADNDADKSFAYALVSGGTGGGITVTAKRAITLTIYYGASDSKFATLDQSKSGNLSWTIDGGDAVTSLKTENKSNKVAYSETVTLEAGQVIVFTVSSNRFVLYGLSAK